MKVDRNTVEIIIYEGMCNVKHIPHNVKVMVKDYDVNEETIYRRHTHETDKQTTRTTKT